MSENKPLPGTLIKFSHVGSCGNHTNAYGVGEMSLYVYRPGNKYSQLYLGNIFFSNPTPDQLKEAEEINKTDHFSKEASNIHSVHCRVSFTQAQYITKLISDMLMKEFKDGIPSDEEIVKLIKHPRVIDKSLRREMPKFPPNRILSEDKWT